MKPKTGPERKSPEEYRWLAKKVRETAQTASTERELLAMAKIWDFLAEHCAHHPH
jgi:hypothetical protein